MLYITLFRALLYNKLTSFALHDDMSLTGSIQRANLYECGKVYLWTNSNSVIYCVCSTLLYTALQSVTMQWWAIADINKSRMTRQFSICCWCQTQNSDTTDTGGFGTQLFFPTFFFSPLPVLTPNLTLQSRLPSSKICPVRQALQSAYRTTRVVLYSKLVLYSISKFKSVDAILMNYDVPCLLRSRSKGLW